MKLIIAVLSILALGTILYGENVPQNLISWDKVRPDVGEVIRPTQNVPFTQVKIVNSASKPMTAQLTTVRRFVGSIIASGKVRYENVEGTGYLEMWTVFPDGSRYSSRTLGTGLMAPIKG